MRDECSAFPEGIISTSNVNYLRKERRKVLLFTLVLFGPIDLFIMSNVETLFLLSLSV